MFLHHFRSPFWLDFRQNLPILIIFFIDTVHACLRPNTEVLGTTYGRGGADSELPSPRPVHRLVSRVVTHRHRATQVYHPTPVGLAHPHTLGGVRSPCSARTFSSSRHPLGVSSHKEMGDIAPPLH